LPTAIEQALQDSAEEARLRDITVVAEYPAHLPAVAGDRQQIASVLTSLIGDAIVRLEGGEVRLRAEILEAGSLPAASRQNAGEGGKLAEGGPWALLTVSETPVAGKGLADANLPVGQGKRLTWQACVELARTLGGVLWTERTDPTHTIRRLALPLRGAEPQTSRQSSLWRAMRSHLPSGEAVGRTLLLLVESGGLRRLLEKDLAAEGYRVLFPQAGEPFLEVARREVPDLILLDVLAREPSAFDTAVLLKQDRRTRSIPVLFITSVDDPEAGVRMEAARLLVRPGGTGALLSSIQSVLQSGVGPSSRVLVVEPERATREMLIRMIQVHGYRVSEATTPEEAMALAERAAPRMALLNAHTAKERDFWLLRQLRRLSSDTEIIVLAEAMSADDARAVLQRGASGTSKTGELPNLLRQGGRGNGRPGLPPQETHDRGH
jgi:DNA-binding response OmpR family regulator